MRIPYTDLPRERGFYLSPAMGYRPEVEDWIARVTAASGTFSELGAQVGDEFVADLVAAGVRTKTWRAGICTGTNRAAMQIPLLLGDGTTTYGSAADTISTATTDGDKAYYGTECIEAGIHGGVYLNTAPYNGSGFTVPTAAYTANINLATVLGANRPHSVFVWYGDNWMATGTTNQTRGFIDGANSHVTQFLAGSPSRVWFNQNGFGSNGLSISNPVNFTGFAGYARTSTTSSTCYRGVDSTSTLGTIAGVTAGAPNANLTLLANGHIPSIQAYWVGETTNGTEANAIRAAFYKVQQGLGRLNLGRTLYIGLGDSITSGYTGTGGITPYTETLKALKPTWKIRNFSKPGITLGDGSLAGARQIYNSNVAGLRPDDRLHTRCIIGLLIGTNDLNNGVPATTLQSNVESLCTAARGLGFEIVVITPPHRDDTAANVVGGQWTSTKETERTTFRTNMLASTAPNQVLNGDVPLPNGSDAAKFQADRLHPNAAGLAALASYIADNVTT